MSIRLDFILFPLVKGALASPKIFLRPSIEESAFKNLACNGFRSVVRVP